MASLSKQILLFPFVDSVMAEGAQLPQAGRQPWKMKPACLPTVPQSGKR